MAASRWGPEASLITTFTLALALLTGGCFMTASPSVSTSASLQSSCVPVSGGMVSWWDGDHVSGATAFDIWGAFTAAMSDVGSIPGEVGNAFWMPGYGSSIKATYKPAFSPTETVSVAAWVNSGFSGAAPVSQTIVEQGTRQSSAFTSSASWTSYNAGNTNGAGTDVGYWGGAFDGRYVYFVPDYSNGNFLQYDTTANFSASGSWKSFDATTIDADEQQFAGAVFDGRYLYYAPYSYGNVLRYDTTKSFQSASSYLSYTIAATAATAANFAAMAFDGRYIYFVPYSGGIVTRYDTQGTFTSSASWTSYNLGTTTPFEGATYDGRYIYFVPEPYSGSATTTTVFYRYDTQSSFSASTSWLSVDVTSLLSTATDNNFSVGIFDGRYVYFPQYYGAATQSGGVLRLDTTGTFTDLTHAWANVNTTTLVSTKSTGFNSGVVDGQYLYLLADYNSGATDGQTVRYDTTQSFAAAGSWGIYDTSTIDGTGEDIDFSSTVFDGRYIYLVPYDYSAGAGTAIGGVVARYDTSGASSSYALRAAKVAATDYGSSVLGPAFEISTANGFFAANATQQLSAGWHFVAGTYDGSNVRLYVDGALTAANPASGALLVNTNELVIGAPGQSNSGFYGGLDEVQLYGTALSASAVQAIYDAGPNGICK